MIIRRNTIKCEECIHYESYHQYPNPNAIAKHYCIKCQQEIKCSYDHNGYVINIFIPKKCYLNNLFEEKLEVKRDKEKREKHRDFCQIED